MALTPELLESIRNSTCADRLNLMGKTPSFSHPGEVCLTAVDVLELAEAMKANHNIEALVLSYNELGDDSAIAIADMLRKNTTLEKIFFYGNAIGDAGAIAIAEALRENTTLRELTFHYNNIGDEGAIALTHAFSYHPILSRLHLKENPISDAAKAEIESLIIAYNPRNLLSPPFDEKSVALKPLCTRNNVKADELQSLLLGSDCRHSPALWWEIYTHLPAIKDMAANSGAFQTLINPFVEFLATLPVVDLEQPLTLEILTTKQGNWAPIDNPRTWQQWDIVVAALNKSGVYLRSAELLEEDGSPNSLLQCVIARDGVNAIFSKANWQGAPRHEINSVLRALPPEIRKTIPNIHTISAKASVSAVHAIGGA